MTYYQIAELSFSLNENEVATDDLTQPINDKTWRALKLLLSSNQEVISKDCFVNEVWQGVVVGDASVFKQIQVVRNIFESLGLPKEVIENVYGKGYRFCLPVVASDRPFVALKKGKTWRHVLPLVAMLLVLLVVGSQTKPEKALLNDNDKKSILTLSKNNWQDGLEHIQALFKEEKPYSNADLAFLYHQKGQAELNVQQFDSAKQSLNQAKQLYQGLRAWKDSGDISLQLARLYDYIDDKATQKSHINEAIRLYKKAGAKTKVIDALLEKASHQKQLKAYDAAIETYQQVIEAAKSYGDPVGQMMAINNLAATHQVLNDNQAAIELAEQGLELSMSLGNGQHIANSYSFLSQLYWQTGEQQKALKMLSQSLSYQVETKNHRHLSPKLMNMNFLLLETAQFETANRLLAVTKNYAEALKVKGGSVVIALYQGMNAAHQQQWVEARGYLEQAYQRALEHNFSYKKPTTMAYLSLARAMTGSQLKAVELAQLTLNEERASTKEKTLAQLALAVAYHETEQESLAIQTWAQIDIPADWFFGQISWAQIKLDQTPNTAIEQRLALQGQINEANQQWQQLAMTSAFEGGLLDQVVKQVNQLIETLTKNDTKQG